MVAAADHGQSACSVDQPHDARSIKLDVLFRLNALSNIMRSTEPVHNELVFAVRASVDTHVRDFEKVASRSGFCVMAEAAQDSSLQSVVALVVRYRFDSRHLVFEGVSRVHAGAFLPLAGVCFGVPRTAICKV